MIKAKIFDRRVVSLLVGLLLILPSLLQAIINPAVASAAQLTTRKITIGSSKVSQTDVTYFVSFNTPTGGTIKGIVVDFCANSEGPIIGTACATGPAGFDLNLANLVVANQKINGSTVANTYAINGASTSHTLILTNATGNAAAATNSVTFDLGTNGGANDGVTNQDGSDCSSNNCTFFARILIYSSNVTAAAYSHTTPGTHIDDGGVALSTANQLTIDAKVQEVLQFCVGTTSVDDSTTTIANDCSGVFAGNCNTTVDLGVLDSSVVSISPVPTPAGTPGGGNACNGAAMVRTNASNGIVVTYFAEQDTNSGKLKVPGATCSGSSSTDQCFNDSTTQARFATGTERFGVTVGGTNCNGTTTLAYSCDMSSGTNRLIATAGYIGRTTTAFCDATTKCNSLANSENGFAWDDNGFTTPDQLASSSGPVEDETLVLKFAGAPAITTPTGTYTVVSTYIATATF